MKGNAVRITTKRELNEVLKVERAFYPVGMLIYLLQGSERAILRKHQILLRKAEYYTNTRNWLLAAFYKLRLNLIQNRYALHIPLNTCGKGLKIMHIGPILINSNAKVGEYCSFHINTAVVAAGSSDGAPVIGNHVVIGIGAVILGNIKVADYTAIGANAVVNKTVEEENIAVAGIPARKISNNGNKSWNKKN